MKKFYLSFLLVFSMISTIVYAGNLVKKVYFSPYPIKINGEEYSSEMPILQYQERTYVALREFSEMVDVEVDFINNEIIINSEKSNAKIENLEVEDFVKEESKENEINTDEKEISKKNVVYISKTGKKYHRIANCNSATYFEISLSEAISNGYTPCLRCAK